MSESQPGQPSDTSATDSDPSLADSANRGMEDLTRSETAPFELSQEPVTPEGEIAPGSLPATPAPAYEHLGELPATYHTQSVYLVAYDPKQLFAYWDVDWTGAPATPYALHVCRADGSLEQEAEIAAAEAGKYLPVRSPGGTYFVELGRHGRDGSWQVIATSTNVTMPPAGLAGETEPKFATLPFHLSFQRLLELIQETMGTGEDLTAALARLQRADRSGLDQLVGTLSRLGPEPLQTLEALLGQKFDVSSAGGDLASPAGGHLHRDRHDVLAAGAFSSEGLSSADLGSRQGFGSASLERLGGGSETLASGGFSSGAPAGGIGGENLSSGGFSSGILGVLGGGSETLAAYAAGLSSESLSSFGGSSGSGGFGGGESHLPAEERAAQLLRVLEGQLGMLGGLFSGSGSGGLGASDGFSPGGR